MPRPLDTNVLAATLGQQIIMAAAVRLQFTSGVVLANTSPYAITINGESYAGVGEFGRVSTVQESIENRSADASIELSGVIAADIALALNSGYRNQPATIYAVLFDQNHRIIGTPIIVFQGLMDQMVIALDTTGTVTLSLSNRLADWDRPRIRRYTDEDQQASAPGDLGCSFVAALQDKVVLWGMKT